MPLDFYDINDIRLSQKLFELDETDIETLEPVLSSLKKTTGVTIDPYGTTRIYANHIWLMISLIQRSLLTLNNSILSKHAILSRVLARFKEVQEGFIIIGD